MASCCTVDFFALTHLKTGIAINRPIWDRHPAQFGDLTIYIYADSVAEFGALRSSNIVGPITTDFGNT